MSAPIRILLFLWAFVGPGLLSAQGPCAASIQLVDVQVDPGAAFVPLRLLAVDESCGAMQNLQAGDLDVREQIGAGPALPVEVMRVTPNPMYDTLDLKREPIDVLFLVDVSSLGSPAASADMIRSFLDRYGNRNATYTLQTFSDIVHPARALSPEEPSAVLDDLGRQGGEPHLHAALIGVLRELATRPSKQLLFVFSGGENRPPDYGERPVLPPRKEDVFGMLENLGDRLYLFTISSSAAATAGGGSPSSNLMRELPALTTRTDDGYAEGKLPDAVDDIFGSDRRLLSTHTVEINSNNKKFTGQQRRYFVRDANNADAEPTSAGVVLGSVITPVTLGPGIGTSLLVPTLIGLAGVGGMLAVFYFLVPMLRRQRFQKEFVVPYQPQAGRHILDPMTREPIPAGEPVVNVCEMLVPLQTWRDCGDQCPHFPGCTNNNLQCDGSGRGHSLNFFALHGVNRRLNWIWFGALGGFVGWLLYALVDGLAGGSITAFTREVSGYRNAEALVGDVLSGACFGLGLTLMLSIMEERSQSRRLSVRRILLRTLLGGIISIIAFGGGVMLLGSGIVAQPLFAFALSWVVFGLGLGIVLTLRSSIERKRGIAGGLLAGVTGFLVYWLSLTLVGDEMVPKVISLLVSGALLGLVLDTVVELAESYEIEYVAPSNYRRRVPLSKWLKSDWNIMIGTQPGSQVYVKWPDEDVLPEHAQIKLDGGRVYLFPHGETLINGHIINGQKRTQLESGDTIQLGRRSVTQMRFWER
ncbi:FHA domain-containing protein [Lewinella sp. IMCC34183]|uniref:FHA domain-containing protein n=1 Tax=Lewinella sp. IMCC34183 TaxID=2248762 RepID=UPI000E286E5B|nr:FHA domain-containing protein [Lewinella sp. IMCC34183]